MSKNPMYSIGRHELNYRNPAPIVKEYVPEPEPYLIYNSWQKDLNEFLKTPHPGQITCLCSQVLTPGFSAFIRHYMHMNKNSELLDTFNQIAICHTMPQLIFEGHVPRTIFIDLEFVEDTNINLYKILKFLIDGVCMISSKYPGSRIFQINNIIIMGYRYPFFINNIRMSVWNFFNIDRERNLFQINFHNALKIICLQNKTERPCPCDDCINCDCNDCNMEITEIIHEPYHDMVIDMKKEVTDQIVESVKLIN